MVSGSRLCGCRAVNNIVLIIFTALFTAGCASSPERADQGDKPAISKAKEGKSEVDPYESFNRSMFKFNDHLDDYVAKPISDAYLWITPHFFQNRVSNFFSNLKDINVLLNDNMQGKFEQGAEDTGRFLTNSTIGLLGLFDVATELGLSKHEEDFGQTLAVWGVPQGAYLVLPILGPTTARGVPGGVLDTAANPTSYIGMPVQLLSMLNTRANAEGALKFIDEASIDPYVFTREAYLQNQQHLISDGKGGTNVDVLPLEDELFNDDATDKTKKTDKIGDKNNPLFKADKSLDNAVVALDKAAASLKESSAKLDQLKKKPHKKPLKPAKPIVSNTSPKL